MLLSPKALKKANEPEVRLQIAIVLKVTERTVSRYIEQNSKVLTSFDVLDILRKETGWADREILIADNPKNKKNAHSRV